MIILSVFEPLSCNVSRLTRIVLALEYYSKMLWDFNKWGRYNNNININNNNNSINIAVEKVMLREYCFSPCQLLTTNLSDIFFSFQLFFFGKASFFTRICLPCWTLALLLTDRQSFCDCRSGNRSELTEKKSQISFFATILQKSEKRTTLCKCLSRCKKDLTKLLL